MALVKCPECGREKVSDSAEACPECGYGIKAYFEKIRKEEEREKQRIYAEKRKQEQKLKEKEKSEQRIKSVPKPEKPVFSRGLIIYMICASLFFGLIIASSPNKETTNWTGAIVEILVIVFLPAVIYYCCFYSKKWHMYQLSMSDFEEYQRQIVKEEDEQLAQAIERGKARAKAEAMQPECPYCHSHNTSKITTTAKAVNVAMFGVLGQKRKYQWHCNNCKSNF